MNVLIYGMGQTGEQIYKNIKQKCNVIGFLDSNIEKKGLKYEEVECLGGIEVLKDLAYDKIYIGSYFWEDIKNRLLDAGVKESAVIIDIPKDVDSPVRNTFLECFAKQWSGKSYAVAEGGVYRGEFAAVINRCFPQSKLYLFDTFQGFDERDVAVEHEKNFSNSASGVFSDTSVKLVLSKMEYQANVEIHEGYFPESAIDVKDEFCFVNLDFDLYHPILEGLRFFFPQTVRGGVLLVHDYYHAFLQGVRIAIDEYEKECGHEILKMPIGDGQSVALIKE